MSLFSENPKILIVSGDSYTDSKYTETHKFPVWPELLAKKLKMECVNLGRSGQGNEYISSSLLDTISELKNHKNIGLVIPMWSEFSRIDFAGRHGQWAALHFPAEEGTLDRHNQEWKNRIMKDLYTNGLGRSEPNLKKSLRIFYMFQQTMKSLNIPFLQVIGTQTIPWPAAKIIDSPYLKLIDKNLFCGWPAIPEVGGWHVDSFLDGYEYEDVRMGLDDCHPNDKGHSLISKKLYQYYEARYGTIF